MEMKSLFCAFYITFIILMMANVLTSDLHISLFIVIIIWCSYILFSFIFHLFSFISLLSLHSSTYVMYILLLSIKTDIKQVKEAALAVAKCSLFIMCYVHILNHKWTSVYKSLCLLPRQLFACYTVRMSVYTNV